MNLVAIITEPLMSELSRPRRWGYSSLMVNVQVELVASTGSDFATASLMLFRFVFAPLMASLRNPLEINATPQHFSFSIRCTP